ncbi:olfactory receptor 1500-like [Dendropsophus ebraccatus]|uniref:olfactory receptor 1500-like n=1 Tax=Dendropsophus ebraccatus TaxID=150705 RepID=UPI0038321C38
MMSSKTQVRAWSSRKQFQFADIVDPLSQTLLPFKKLVDRNDLTTKIHHFMLTPLGSLTVSKPTAFEQLVHMNNNKTKVEEFFLLGFDVSLWVRLFLTSLFLIVYWLILCGNLLIIILVSTSKILHTPMYFFISQLSITDILVSTDIVPNLLHILLSNGMVITFIGCFAQFYLFGVSEFVECIILVVMSYDRYVAICNPLRYTSIMTGKYCRILITACWLLGFSIVFMGTLTIAILNYCGPNVINHFFCDLAPLLDLACSDKFLITLEIYLLSIPVIVIPSTIIAVTYTYIVSAILRIPSSTGRQKAFSTCSSHLIVVSIFYWTLFGVYVVPKKGQTLIMSKILSLLYTVFIPLVNPILYSLRNEDFKKAVHGTLHKRMTWDVFDEAIGDALPPQHLIKGCIFNLSFPERESTR